MSYTTPSTAQVADQLSAPKSLLQKKATKQFVKFSIVGFSSTVINFAFYNLLYHKTSIGLVPSLSVAFLLSALNGFFWNRTWTFKEARVNSAATQSLRFFLVNLVGWVLSTSIVVLIIAHYVSGGKGFFGGDAHFAAVVMAVISGQGKQFGTVLPNLALGAATCVVVFWNFFANRLWTFKHQKPA